MELLPIPGYPDYVISDSGRVFSDKYSSRRERSTFKGKDGYLRVILSRGKNIDGYDTRYVHRLVAQAFVPNPDSLPSVIHKDHNKSNNQSSNLRWGTHQESLHLTRTHTQNLSSSPTNHRAVTGISKETKATYSFPSLSHAALYLGHKNKAANIHRSCQTGRPAYGILWQFV